MLSDPQSLTISGSAISFPRTSTAQDLAVYTASDLTRKLRVQHSLGKRIRRVARLDREKTAADPLFPAQNRPYTMSCYVVMDVPTFGFSVTEVVDEVAGLTTWLTASTNANLIKIAGGQS